MQQSHSPSRLLGLLQTGKASCSSKGALLYNKYIRNTYRLSYNQTMEKIEEGFALCFRNYYNFFLHFSFRMVRYEHYFVMKEIFGVNLAKLNNVSGTGVKSLKKKYDFFCSPFLILKWNKKKKK